MSEGLKHCEACEGHFEWDDYVVVVDEKKYHNRCLDLFPISYGAFLEGEYIGETENEDGNLAFEFLGEGEYEDE